MTTLLVASPGGHLDELLTLSQHLGLENGPVVFVTARTVQTESLLEGRCVRWVRHVGSGDYARAATSVPSAIRLHQQVRPDLVITTGAALAVPHLIAASIKGTEAWYIESATRRHGPSRSGQSARLLPGVRCFAQQPGWGDPYWELLPNVFEAFEVTTRHPARGDASVTSAVVTLGTEKYPFPRAVDRVAPLLSGATVTWQTGSTVCSLNGAQLPRWLPAQELGEACTRADVIVTHAGVGSVLMALSRGKVPVVLPRRASQREHIDDHQLEIAGMLDAQGLAISVDADKLSANHLLEAAGLQAHRRTKA